MPTHHFAGNYSVEGVNHAIQSTAVGPAARFEGLITKMPGNPFGVYYGDKVIK